MYTPLRKKQYDELRQLSLDGKILDLGGTKNGDYHRLIKGNHKITVVNLSESYGYDLKFDVEKDFPLPDNSYDAVICLNLLEHLFNYQNTINESYRILKKGGVIVGSTPFLYNIHGSPDDFFRYTSSALRRILETSGFKDVDIKELGSGMFGASYQIKYNFYYKLGFIKFIALGSSIVIDKLLIKLFPNKHSSNKYFPVGYFFKAKK